MSRVRALAVAVLFPGALAAVAQPAMEQPSPGAWADGTFRWSYNGANHPSWLDGDTARQLVIAAAAKWEVCGVRMQYTGDTTAEPGVMDGRNVVGWRIDLPPGARGITRGRAAAGRLLERDIAFSGERLEFQRHPRLLEKVLVHEFGHAIGLTHSARCDDVMTLAADCPRADPERLPLLPTAHDLERCRALYEAREAVTPPAR